MRGPKPTPIKLSERQQSILEQIVRRHSSSQQQVKRARLILTMASGKNNQQTAHSQGMHRETVQQWRRRWLDAVARNPVKTGSRHLRLLVSVERSFVNGFLFLPGYFHP
jgi:protein-tyrosine-phosphatase